MSAFGIKSKSDKIIERCAECASYIAYASETTKLSDFVEMWRRFRAEAEAISQDPDIDRCSEQAAMYVSRIKDWYDSDRLCQAKMRDVMEAQGQISKRAVQYNLNNNVSAKVNLYLDVAAEFADNKELFSEETLDFAQRVLDRIYVAVGQDNISRQIILPEWKEIPELQGGRISIEYVDSLNGSAFEVFCADLLERNGFGNIELLAKTGNQGVDITAQKDSIRYAFQCKCYSSDLGNAPVQEVYAGKEMYGCHVGVVMTNQHFTSGARALAEKTHVLLWDREKLITMMEKM